MENLLLKISLVFFLFFILGLKEAQAVIPPDFIFNIGSQIIQIFSLVFVFLTAIFSFFYQYVKNKLVTIKISKFIFLYLLIFVLGISTIVTLLYGHYKQKCEYNKWLAESKAYEREALGLNISEKELSEKSFLIQENEEGLDKSRREIDVKEHAAVKNKLAMISREAVDFSFFENNINAELSLDNADFREILDNNKAPYILDAREDLEYESGHLPGSVHIRLIDLQFGRWEELPRDKFIYVLCWSGIRGKITAEYLRSKKISAKYLLDGAKGWFNSGGDWDGHIKFEESYPEDRYKKLLTLNDLKKQAQAGVKIVDAREKVRFDYWHILESVNISILQTPTIKMDEVFSTLPSNSSIIVVCDSYVNCFDAKMTAVELEERGHTFLGRYNKPWEYRYDS